MLAIAGAGSIATADPLALTALEGPYPTLRTFCEHEVAGSGGLLDIGECPIARVTPLEAVWTAATFIRFDAHVGEPIWYAALLAHDGWYVTPVPICSGRGCEPFIGAIALLNANDGPWLAKSSAGWLQPERPGPIPYSLEQRIELICAQGSAPAPVCTGVPVTISITQEPDPEATPRTKLAARAKLAVAAQWRSHKLVIKLSGPHRVTGNNREATEWRKTIAAIVGRHVLAMPDLLRGEDRLDHLLRHRVIRRAAPRVRRDREVARARISG